MERKEDNNLSYKKTASDLRKAAIDVLEVLSINFIVFYYLIFQASKVDDKPLLDLKNGLKYSYEALYNKDALVISLIVGVIAFFIAACIRPKEEISINKTLSRKEKILNCIHSSLFGFFRRVSRSFLSLAITLSLFTFVATTHGYFDEKANFLDLAIFIIYIYFYIWSGFYLSYDSKTTKNKNISNVLIALKMIFITLLSVSALALFVYLELNYQITSQLWQCLVSLVT